MNNHPSGSESRISAIFAKANAESRCALVPFVVTGDPNLQQSEAILRSIAAAGADLIELGVPYSDPIADGPSIVAASRRALENGVTMESVLELAAKSPIPVILFAYANPVMQYGVRRLAERLAEAGAYGAIIPDLPLEETRAISVIFAECGLEIPLLVAPTTPPERAQRIVNESRGFVYLVARLGVTGANAELDMISIRAQLMTLRSMTSLPIAVGFGISRPDHVAAISILADGAIVGSALIDSYAAKPIDQAADAAGAFMETLSTATRRQSITKH